MLDKHWGTECAFKMHQENSLIDRKEQDKSREESKHKIEVSQVFDDDSNVDPRSNEARSDASKEAGHEFCANTKQRNIREASGKAQHKGKYTKKNATETSSSVSRGEKQKKRKHSAIEDEISERNFLSTGRSNLARDHASEHDHTGYDICSSSPPRSSTVEHGNGNKSRYGMFPPPPPPPRATTPPVQDTSEPQRHREENHFNVNRDTGSRAKSTLDPHKDNSNTQFENNGYNNDDDQDEDEDEDKNDDQNILNAKLAAAEAAFNLAQLRVAAAESAARKAKKARKSTAGRGNSVSSF